MASLIKRAKGMYSVRVMIGYDRKTIALGTRSEDRANRARAFIQDLATARTSGELPEPETKRWASNLSEKLRQRLAAVGLLKLAPDDSQRATLADFVKEYIDRYGPAKKPATVTTWRQCQRLLLEFFPADKPLDSFTPGDAEDFRNHLLTRKGRLVGTRQRQAKPLSEATTRRRCGCAKTFFAYAVSKGLIQRNPFDSKRVPTTAPRSKQKQFVSLELAERIMDKLPDAQWRLLFALARWGGMRVPSEPEVLTWENIDFERQRIRFRSPKTEHHEGRDRREIPIFPELMQPLLDVAELADKHEPLVLPNLHTITSAALRKPMLKAFRLAHVKPWPKLWNSLRATRRTELLDRFPTHVVDMWIGHTEEVGNRHYSQVLDSHYESALQKCSHFSASSDSHREAGDTETPRKCRTLRHCFAW